MSSQRQRELNAMLTKQRSDMTEHILQKFFDKNSLSCLVVETTGVRELRMSLSVNFTVASCCAWNHWCGLDFRGPGHWSGT